MAIEYPQDFIDRLHLLWGNGFMSPGGPEEVRRVVSGLNIEGAKLLDIGCGTGGPTIVLARDLGARVTGADVEDLILKRAAENVAAAGLSDRVSLVRIDPGPLPFAENTFDFVFSKDALIHVADKDALYREILRVLKPGGTFVASDWLAGEGAASDPDFRAFVAGEDLTFVMLTSSETAAKLAQAGFAGVETEDRNSWYAETSARELEALKGPLRERALGLVGQAGYDTWMVRRSRIARMAASGSLRPTDMRGRKPAG